MADTPVFQRHHVIEQAAFRDSVLLQALSERGLFDIHSSRNLLNLPADQSLANRLEVSPHTGGPLGGYSDRLNDQLERLQSSVDGQATLRGDQAAAERMAARVHNLTDTLKVGLTNGDLLTNTPQGMTPEQANRQIREFFGDIEGYQQRHAAQIAELDTMQADEARWVGVTKSEANVRAAVHAIDQPGVKAAAGDAVEARQSLGTAIEQANHAGRLPLSDVAVRELHAVMPRELPVGSLQAQTPSPQTVHAPGRVTASESIPTHGRQPGAGMGVKSLGVLGAAATVYDAADTLHDVSRLRSQGNGAATEDRITRFATQNVAGWGGVVAGASAGVAAGVETGPGLLVTGAIGGIVGAVAGDKVADWIRDYKINNQQDQQGNNWTFDPARPAQGWSRLTRTNELDFDAMRFSEGAPVYKWQRSTADPALADELTYKASSRSMELALGAPPQGRDPYRLPASTAEQAQRTPFETGRVWTQDPNSHQWRQEISAMLDGRVPSVRYEPASPERAAQLQQQSQAIIAVNATRTPAAMAAQYQAAYQHNDWSRHGPMPEAAQDALRHPGRIMGSDGDLYERNSTGQWTHDGMLWDSHAEGNLKRELEATYQQQQQNLKITTLEPVTVRPDPVAQQETAQPPLSALIQPAHPDRTSPSSGHGVSNAVAQAQTDSPHAHDDRDANLAAQQAAQQQTFLAQQHLDQHSRQTAQEQDNHQETERKLEQARDSDHSPQTAQAAAEAPNPWDQTEAGQYINNYMAAFERGDKEELNKLSEAYAQTPQFKEWDEWGKENYQLSQLEQQQQNVQEQQQSRGFGR